MRSVPQQRLSLDINRNKFSSLCHPYQLDIDRLCALVIMGDPAVVTVPQAEKRFKTQLTDYAVRREGGKWPYTDDIDVDALIVGAGFSEFYHRSPIGTDWSIRC